MAVFGSFAIGTAKGGSDIDLIVECAESVGLSDLVRLELALERELQRSIDVFTEGSLHTTLKERILKERVALF